MGSTRNRAVLVIVLLVIFGGGAYFMSTAFEKAERVQATKLKPIAKREKPTSEPSKAKLPAPTGDGSSLPVAAGSPVSLALPAGSEAPQAGSLAPPAGSPAPIGSPPPSMASAVAGPPPAITTRPDATAAVLPTPRPRVSMATPEPLLPTPLPCDWATGDNFLNLRLESYLLRINLKNGLAVHATGFTKFIGRQKSVIIAKDAETEAPCAAPGCYVFSQAAWAMLDQVSTQLRSFTCREWVLVSDQTHSDCTELAPNATLLVTDKPADRCALGVLVDVRPTAPPASSKVLPTRHAAKGHPTLTAYLTERKSQGVAPAQPGSAATPPREDESDSQTE